MVWCTVEADEVDLGYTRKKPRHMVREDIAVDFVMQLQILKQLSDQLGLFFSCFACSNALGTGFLLDSITKSLPLE